LFLLFEDELSGGRPAIKPDFICRRSPRQLPTLTLHVVI